MSSLNAQAVAREVSEKIRNGERVNLGKIIKKRYSLSTSKRPVTVTKTKSYQEAIYPLLESLEKERTAALEQAKKKRNKAQYHQLIEAVDKLTKNIQILSGGRTGDETFVITWQK